MKGSQHFFIIPFYVLEHVPGDTSVVWVSGLSVSAQVEFMSRGIIDMAVASGMHGNSVIWDH